MNINKMRKRIRAVRAALMGPVPSMYDIYPWSSCSGLSGSLQPKKYLEAYRGWVYGAVRIISSTAAAGQIRFYVQDKMGNKQVLQKGHPLVDLFDKPNMAMTRWYLCALTFSWLELTGKAYWLKVRDKMGVVRRLLPLQPDWIRVVPDKRDIIYGFLYVHGGKNIALDKKDMVYLRYPHPSVLHEGMGPLQAAAYSYDADLDMHKYDKNLFAHGASVKSVLETDQYLSEEDANRLRDEWKRLYGRPENANAVAILHNGIKYNKAQMSPQELDFEALRRLTRQEIFAIFGVSEGLLGMVEDVNRTNNIQLMDSFIRFTMQPKADMIQEQIDKDITEEVDPAIVTEFELPKAIDAVEEHSKMEIRLRNYMTSINEEREKLGMKPVFWGEKPWFKNTVNQERLK